MFPEYLVSLRLHLSNSLDNTTSTDNSENLTQEKITLSDYESDILISSATTGQSRSMLFEEYNRYLKGRLFCAAKIESFPRLLNSLQTGGNINAQESSKILTQKTAIINGQGNKIWFNLITRRASDPIFYSLGEKQNERY